MEPLITFVKENQAILAVAIIILIPIGFIYQKQAAPILFHMIEYLLYLSVAHTIIYAGVQVVAWYKLQTPDINGETSIPFNTPINPLAENFFDKTLYSPTGLIYFEALVALGLLYIVVIVRPTAYSASNKYKGNKERGMPSKSSPSGRRSRYDRNKANDQRSQKS